MGRLRTYVAAPLSFISSPSAKDSPAANVRDAASVLIVQETRRNSHGPSSLCLFSAFARCSLLWTVCPGHDERGAGERGGAGRSSHPGRSSRVRRESVGDCTSAACLTPTHPPGATACVGPYFSVQDSLRRPTALRRDDARTGKRIGPGRRPSRSWSKPRTANCIKTKATDEDDGSRNALFKSRPRREWRAPLS